jgi:GNAT superfamily N-acetyltransferase
MIVSNPMNVVPARGALLDEILDLTHPIWGEGLSRRAYAQWNAAQTATPWGRQHLQRVALVDEGGALLATAKRYRFAVRLAGRTGWMCGIGALFTPPDRRGHGYGARLVERLVQDARTEGALVAGLFSEIGTDYYTRLGFAHVPLDEVTVTVERKWGAPAMLVRSGEERDLEAVAAMHDVRARGVPFALLRPAALVGYAIARKRLLAGLGPSGLRQVEFFVAEEGATAVAYVLLTQNAHGWTLQEAGDRDPAGARLGGMLQVLLAREPSHRIPLIRAWWPRTFPVPVQVDLRDRSGARDAFMLRPLADVPIPARAEDVFYWRSDYF